MWGPGMGPEGQRWNKRREGGGMGVGEEPGVEQGPHRNLEMFAPRGRSRTGVFTTKPCSLGHAPHHPPLCVQVPVVTAWPTTTWVGCVPGTGSLGPAHMDPRRGSNHPPSPAARTPYPPPRPP